jgi:hypothetical protein
VLVPSHVITTPKTKVRVLEPYNSNKLRPIESFMLVPGEVPIESYADSISARRKQSETVIHAAVLQYCTTISSTNATTTANTTPYTGNTGKEAIEVYDDGIYDTLECYVQYQIKDSNNYIVVYENQLKCLDDEEWLDDTIIEFYLQYRLSQIDSDRATPRPDIYCFSTMFMDKLSSQGYRKGLDRWTQNIDLFEKHLIIVPINIKDYHWMLAVICMTGKYKHHMWFMDSSKQIGRPAEYASKLSTYLTKEWFNKKKTNETIELKLSPVNVPQQDNGNDCGLYLLQYIVQIYEHPPNPNEDIDTETWDEIFNANSCLNLRANILQVLRDLHKRKDNTCSERCNSASATTSTTTSTTTTTTTTTATTTNAATTTATTTTTTTTNSTTTTTTNTTTTITATTATIPDDWFSTWNI